MEFALTVNDYRPIGDLFQIIYATGSIEFGDAQKLEDLAYANKLIPSAYIYIDTPGGSLHEGIALGRVVTKLGFNTNVGRKVDGKAVAGVCASAGVWFYLGGIFRFMLEGSKLGVHQFFASDPMLTGADYLSIGQVHSGLVVEYISECRAKTYLFSLMSSTSPQDMNFIDHQVLRDLNVITDNIYSIDWSFQFISGVPYLRGHIVEERGEHKLLFMPTPKGEILVTVFFGNSEKEMIKEWYDTMFLFLEWEHYQIPVSDIGMTPEPNNDFVMYIFSIPVEIGERALECEWIGAGTQPINKDIYSGFRIKLGVDG